MINLQVRDPAQGGGDVYAGVYFHNGKPKPALTAFRFPFVTDRTSADVVRAWGKAPRGGRLTIERKHGGGWKRVKRLKVGNGKVFTTKLRLVREGPPAGRRGRGAQPGVACALNG